MPFSRSTVYAAACALLAFRCAAAQSTTPNVDIVKMIQAGLPEGTVVNKIREGAGRWDTSVDALVTLKRAGATNAELDALTAPPAAAPAGPAAPVRVAEVPAFGGLLGRTAAGVPYIQFQSGVLLPTLTGEPSNRIFLVRDGANAMVVIPASFAHMDLDIGFYGLNAKYMWDGSHEGNLLWSAAGVRFEDLCLVPDVSSGIKDKNERKRLRENPGPELDQFYAQKKQIADIHPPLAFREKKSLFYLGTIKNDKLTGDVFILGVTGYTWPGRTNNEPAPAQYRSPELQALVDRLIEHPTETIAEMIKVARLPDDVSSWPAALDYSYNTKETARHYANVNANFVAELKAKQPASSNGLASLVNVVQGVSNMAQAQSAANLAAANHDMAGQLNAAINAGTAEMQTLNAISNPSAPAIQPLAPGAPNALSAGANGTMATSAAATAGASRGSLLYTGPNAEWVRRILNTAGPYTCSPNGKPKVQLATGLACQVDNTFAQAQLLAWAVECEEETGFHDQAVKISETLVQTLDTVKQQSQGAVRYSANGGPVGKCHVEQMLSINELP